MPKVEWCSKVEWVQTAALRAPAWNYKHDGNEDEVERFRQSLLSGKVTPLHVAECEEEPGMLEVFDGAHRLKQIQAMKIKKVPVYNHGILSSAQRKNLSLRYNGDWFQTEAVPLAKCVAEVQDLIADAAACLPFSDVELEQILSMLDTDVDAGHVDSSMLSEDELEEPPRKKHAKKTNTVQCPHCGTEFEV